MSAEVQKIRRSEETQVREQRQEEREHRTKCQVCSKVFRRQGDLKRHKCRTVTWMHFLHTHLMSGTASSSLTLYSRFKVQGVCVCVCVCTCPNSILHYAHSVFVGKPYSHLTYNRCVFTQYCSDLSRLLFTFHRYCGNALALTTTMHLHKLLASQLERSIMHIICKLSFSDLKQII